MFTEEIMPNKTSNVLIIMFPIILLFSAITKGEQVKETSQNGTTETNKTEQLQNITTETNKTEPSQNVTAETNKSEQLQNETIESSNGMAETPAETAAFDPFEKFNRRIFYFNKSIDQAFIRPVARAYDTVMPSFAQKGVRNFFGNIGQIPTIANDVLQINIKMAISDTARFVVNSTLGILGLFDVATHFGLKENTNDLGLTFAKWGAKKTPYLIIPILGPSTIGDAAGYVLNYNYLTVWPHVHPGITRYELIGLNIVDKRSDMLAGDKVIEQAFDQYVLVRNGYQQRRDYLLEKLNGK